MQYVTIIKFDYIQSIIKFDYCLYVLILAKFKMVERLKVDPTFLLKGLDYVSVEEEYRRGRYRDYDISDIPYIGVNINSLVSDIYGSDPSNGIYTFRDAYNTEVTICTTGHNDHIRYLNDNNNIINTKTTDSDEDEDDVDMNRCEWCRAKIRTEMVARTITDREEFVISKPNNTITSYVVYYGEGRFCDFECQHGYFIRMGTTGWKSRSSIYDESEVLTKELFWRMYPDKPFPEAAQDYRLLKRNGGTLTQARYKDKSHHYIPVLGVDVAPVRRHYQQKIINNK